MAVQKSRKSRSKRNIRRAEDTLDVAATSIDRVSGETHRRHHVTADGYYRGRKIFAQQESQSH